jgi:acetoacetyl-CoA synthetase
VLDRFRQIEPKVLIAVDGVTYGGRDHDRLGVLAELRAAAAQRAAHCCCWAI